MKNKQQKKIYKGKIYVGLFELLYLADKKTSLKARFLCIFNLRLSTTS